MDLYGEFSAKFSLKTHTFILLMRGRNYLGGIHLDDGFSVFCCAGQQMRRHDANYAQDARFWFIGRGGIYPSMLN